MQIASRCLPLGALPYTNTEATMRMSAKLYEKMPSLMVLPMLDNEESIITRTLQNVPGIKIVNSKKILLKTTSNKFKHAVLELDTTYNTPTIEALETYAIKSVFLESFFNLLKKFQPPNACINLLGPFSLSQMVESASEDHVLTDKSCRKLFIQAVVVKALWAINQIKKISPNTTPIIVLEEPLLGEIGNIKRENEDVTVDIITNLFARAVEKLKNAGAIVAVQCMEKCDWQVPIAAGVDIISFDAYNNPNNLSIIPEQVTEFLEKGGKINWAIVPVMSEAVVKALNINMLTDRLFATMQGLILSGVPEHLVYNSALVSIQGNVDKLPLIFAEKAVILATQLAKKIPIK